MSVSVCPFLPLRGVLMFPDGQGPAHHTSDPQASSRTLCLEPMQGTCPQGVLSQAEMPPALVSVCFKCHLPCLLMSQQARVSIAWLE